MEDEETLLKSADDDIDIPEEWEVFTRNLIDQIFSIIVEKSPSTHVIGNTAFTIAGSLLANMLRAVSHKHRKRLMQELTERILKDLEDRELTDKE